MILLLLMQFLRYFNAVLLEVNIDYDHPARVQNFFLLYHSKPFSRRIFFQGGTGVCCTSWRWSTMSVAVFRSASFYFWLQFSEACSFCSARTTLRSFTFTVLVRSQCFLAPLHSSLKSGVSLSSSARGHPLLACLLLWTPDVPVL